MTAIRQADPGRVARNLGVAIASAPLTVGYVVLLWLLAFATGTVRFGPHGTLRHTVGAGAPALADGRWWTPLTSGFWAHGPTAYVLTTALAVVFLPIAERRLGSVRAAVVLVVAQVAGTLVAVGLVELGAALGGEWAIALSHSTAFGPAGALTGTLLGASAAMDTLWRRRTRLLGVSLLLAMALYAGTLTDLTRLTIGLAGLAAGVLLRPGRRPVSRAPSIAESRALVALLVAVTAVGPLVAVFAGTPIGPLSVLRHVMVPELPDAGTVRALCEAGQRIECRELRAALRLSGAGPAVFSVVPVLLLLVVAEGLRRGRRAAWWAGIGVHTVLFGLGVLQAATMLTTPQEERIFTAGLPAGQSMLTVALPLALPALVLVVLVVARRRFDVARPGTRPLVVAGVVALGGTAIGWLAGGWLARGGFDRRPNMLELVADLPQRFVPPGYLVEATPRILPVSPASTVVFEWTGVVFWLAVTALLLRLFTTQAEPGAVADRERARALLRQDPRSNLGQIAMWSGHRYWFTADGATAFAYRTIGSVALTTGGPFGAPGPDGPPVAEFTAYCRKQGLVSCLYTITEDTAAACRGLGYSTVQVAEETVLPLATLEFTGKRWQDVRTARNRAAKAGVVAEWTTFGQAPLAIAEQIRTISETWIADKGLPEMGFTLGGLTELNEPGTRLLLAVDGEDTVHGVTSWLPVHRDGAVVGWTLDFMRRRTDGFPGVMEFLIAEAALSAKTDGAEFLSLSGAQLARSTAARGSRGCSACSTSRRWHWNRCTASVPCWRSRPSSSPSTARCTWRTRRSPPCPRSAAPSHTPTCRACPHGRSRT
ncbi:hypothetical protein JCM33774_60560 [Actinophytocola sp. KF-1]